MNPFTPPSFKILVPQYTSGDPSLGRNPVVTSSVMTLQHVVGLGGAPRQGGPVAELVAAGAGDHQFSIQVLSTDFWDPSVTAPGPFLPLEEVRIGDQFLVAGEDFGYGMGGGAGTPADVAASLAGVIRARVTGVSVAVVGDTVYVTSNRYSASLQVFVSNDAETLLGAQFFRLKDGAGNVLAATPNYRRSRSLPKVHRTQGPPQLT